MNVCLNSICVSHSEGLKNSHSYRTPHSNIMRRIYWKFTKNRSKNIATIFFGNNLVWLENRALKYAWWDYLKSIGLGQLPTSCTEQCCPTISPKHRWVSALNQSISSVYCLFADSATWWQITSSKRGGGDGGGVGGSSNSSSSSSSNSFWHDSPQWARASSFR
jgi:hypothetical protein